MDTSVALLSVLLDVLSCRLRLREPEREKDRSENPLYSNIDCFVVSVLGAGPRFSKTEPVQRDTVSPSQMNLYKDYQVFSHTHCKICSYAAQTIGFSFIT